MLIIGLIMIVSTIILILGSKAYQKQVERLSWEAYVEDSILDLLEHSRHYMPEAMIINRVRKADPSIDWDECHRALKKIQTSDEINSRKSNSTGWMVFQYNGPLAA